ncbi:hypothetical protein QR680_012449 [Steinernema hermaphroditum]|uniref:Uncharacterized protein n=1 Tax=Steinernema hermaphroditum TaxID=289476 RepID=A0AA39I4T8_9BILA|nr:hypothetical protein QR680_012449 [Steinernema hermaphroditum]
MEKGVAYPDPYCDYANTIASQQKQVDNEWPCKENQHHLPPGVGCHNGSLLNPRIHVATPKTLGGYTLDITEGIFPIICAALELYEPEIRVEEHSVINEFVASTSFHVGDLPVCIGNEKGTTPQEAELNCKLAILHLLVSEEFIREASYEMHAYYKERERRKNREEESVGRISVPLVESSLKLSESEAILLFDGYITGVIQKEDHELVRSFFVDLVLNSANPFTVGMCVERSSFPRYTLYVALYDKRYKKVLNVKEMDNDCGLGLQYQFTAALLKISP